MDSADQEVLSFLQMRMGYDKHIMHKASCWISGDSILMFMICFPMLSNICFYF